MPFGVEYAVRACNCLPDKQDIWTAQDVEQSMLQGSEYLLLVHQDDMLGACAVRVYADGSQICSTLRCIRNTEARDTDAGRWS